MKRLRYVCVAVLLAGPMIVESTHTVHAAGGGLISAGSVRLSGLAGVSGVEGLSNPETHAAEGDEGSRDEPTPGPAPRVEGSKVRAAGAEVGLTFAGLNHRDNRLANNGNQFSSEPPDQALCVGPNHVLEGVNTVLRVYNKDGSPASPTISYNEFFNYPPAINRTTGESGAFLTDPICHFDADSGRFFMAVLTLDQDPDTGQFTGKNRLDIAVSATDDPTGEWKLYKLPVQNDGTEGTPDHHCDPEVTPPPGMTNPAACIGDFPHIGTDNYGVYLTTNEYSFFGDGSEGGFAYTGSQIYAFSKAQLVAGADSPTMVSFENPNLGPFRSFTVWPAISPAGQAASDSGGTEFFLSSTLGDGSETGNFAPNENRIGVWAITNTSSIDSATPNLKLSNKLIKADTYSLPPHATQKDGPTPLRDCVNDNSRLLRSRPAVLGVVLRSAGAAACGPDHARRQRHPDESGDLQRWPSVRCARHRRAGRRLDTSRRAVGQRRTEGQEGLAEGGRSQEVGLRRDSKQRHHLPGSRRLVVGQGRDGRHGDGRRSLPQRLVHRAQRQEADGQDHLRGRRPR